MHFIDTKQKSYGKLRKIVIFHKNSPIKLHTDETLCRVSVNKEFRRMLLL